ncbi:hypothetical protein MMC14_002039 [Varicellaria rhodocarpa]|nr:hypothetical protein [Varicellaria rhodocarpa]
MVNILRVNALINTIFANRDGHFGFQELECTLSFTTSDEMNRTVSTWTSDIALLLFTILLLTFVIDHYIFNGRYRAHILNVEMDHDSNLSLEDEVLLHEKEALDVESGQKNSNEDRDPEPKSKHASFSSASLNYRRGVHRATTTLLGLFVFSLFGSEKPETAFKVFKDVSRRSSTKAKAREDSNKSGRAGKWSRLCRHPWSQRLFSSIMLLLGLVVILCVFACHILFWPALMSIFILEESAIYEDLHSGVTVPRQSIALKLTVYLVLWTIIGVTLLSKPSRFRIMLWKCLKWIHAINWWLFFAILESHNIWAFVVKRMGFYNIEISKAVLFIMRPSLVAYVYSGVLRDAVLVMKVFKYLWYNDITNLTKS